MNTYFPCPWNWKSMSENPNLTINMIKDNRDKPWDWKSITANPNITMDIIINNPDEPWDLESIWENPNITMDMIENNLNNLDTFSLSKNNMVKGKQLWIKKNIHETLIKRKFSDRILSNKLDMDICELIVNYII